MSEVTVWQAFGGMRGVKEFDYYTVLLGVSRAGGMLSQLLISRGLREAIERPNFVGTDGVKNFVSGN